MTLIFSWHRYIFFYLALWHSYVEYTGLLVKLAKQKYRCLRTAYVKERKKVDESKRSGAGTDNMYEPKWKWFKDLDFYGIQLTLYAGHVPLSERKG